MGSNRSQRNDPIAAAASVEQSTILEVEPSPAGCKSTVTSRQLENNSFASNFRFEPLLVSPYSLHIEPACSMNFEFLNYTIITSKCKGPNYPAKACCTSFVEFACPYADYINDGTTDCASTMFSYINLYGSYPPGLFASECSDGKYGLTCPANSPQASDKPSDDSAAARNTQRLFSHFTVTLVLGSVLGFLFS